MIGDCTYCSSRSGAQRTVPIIESSFNLVFSCKIKIEFQADLFQIILVFVNQLMEISETLLLLTSI